MYHLSCNEDQGTRSSPQKCWFVVCFFMDNAIFASLQLVLQFVLGVAAHKKTHARPLTHLAFPGFSNLKQHILIKKVLKGKSPKTKRFELVSVFGGMMENGSHGREHSLFLCLFAKEFEI